MRFRGQGVPFSAGSGRLVNPNLSSVDELPAAALIDPGRLLPGIQCRPEGVRDPIDLNLKLIRAGPQHRITVVFDQVDLIQGPSRLGKGPS